VIKENQKIIQRIRSNILKLSYIAKSSHIGSSLSIVEILFVIYFNILKKGDRFILSKGHAALSLYCTIYEKGFIKKKLFIHMEKIKLS
jgi:transketolase